MKFNVINQKQKENDKVVNVWIELDDMGRPDIHVEIDGEDQIIAYISDDLKLLYIDNKHVKKGFEL